MSHNVKRKSVPLRKDVFEYEMQESTHQFMSCHFEALKFESPFFSETQVVFQMPTLIMLVRGRGRGGRGGRGRGASQPMDEMTEEERRFLPVQKRIDDVEESYSETTESDIEVDNDSSTEDKPVKKDKKDEKVPKKRGRPKKEVKKVKKMETSSEEEEEEVKSQQEMEQRVSDFQFLVENGIEWKDSKISTKKKFLGSYKLEIKDVGVTNSPATTPQTPPVEIQQSPSVTPTPIVTVQTVEVSESPKPTSWRIPKKSAKDPNKK